MWNASSDCVYIVRLADEFASAVATPGVECESENVFKMLPSQLLSSSAMSCARSSRRPHAVLPAFASSAAPGRLPAVWHLAPPPPAMCDALASSAALDMLAAVRYLAPLPSAVRAAASAQVFLRAVWHVAPPPSAVRGAASALVRPAAVWHHLAPLPSAVRAAASALVTPPAVLYLAQLPLLFHAPARCCCFLLLLFLLVVRIPLLVLLVIASPPRMRRRPLRESLRWLAASRPARRGGLLRGRGSRLHRWIHRRRQRLAYSPASPARSLYRLPSSRRIFRHPTLERARACR